MPTNQFMTLYQRYDSLRNSIALLREQILNTPGMEDWLSVQSNYINIMSHVYSIAAALQSASPHFVASQVAALNDFLDSEARDAELFGDDKTEGGMTSLLYDKEDQETDLPPIEDHDPKNRLPELAVHPCLPISDSKLNWLGTLLRTVPEVETSSAEAALIADYDHHHPDAMNEAAISKEMEQHDESSMQALRSWYHLLHAPDEDGNTFDFTMRIETES
ncbi:hypothetical protein MYAM1_000990 [Malassezia yamatoensis]|uniref:Uncharacterized protein n=1 Tax=Malassezia yamatoensis TaxID=253288 RepID=A0AAJ5YQI3_9BASI|nr:hypothetical protein MYAM1_000990 [Malassezia yamatoensis]